MAFKDCEPPADHFIDLDLHLQAPENGRALPTGESIVPSRNILDSRTNEGLRSLGRAIGRLHEKTLPAHGPTLNSLARAMRSYKDSHPTHS